MRCVREPRPSELTFDSVWNAMRNLTCEVWQGKVLYEEAEESVNYIKDRLDLMLRQMRDEVRRKEPNAPA